MCTEKLLQKKSKRLTTSPKKKMMTNKIKEIPTKMGCWRE